MTSKHEPSRRARSWISIDLPSPTAVDFAFWSYSILLCTDLFIRSRPLFIEPLDAILCSYCTYSLNQSIHTFKSSYGRRLAHLLLPHRNFHLYLTLPSNPASFTNFQNNPLLSTSFFGVSNSLTSPASSTTMRSESRIVLIRCAMVMMVRLAKRGERSVVWRRASVSTSTAAVASSRTRMLEGARRARARETSWRWPWERLEPLLRRLVKLLVWRT